MDTEVVICAAVRTPICKARRGAFRHTPPDDLLATVLRAVVQRGGITPSQVQDIVVGNVLGEQSALMARIGQLLAGIPETVPVATVNRQCSSGLQAIATIAGEIHSGAISIGIGAGVESMSQKDMGEVNFRVNPRVAEVPAAADCLLPMGITSENVAEKFGVTRAKQDAFAAESHRRAAAAQAGNEFDAEIVPTEAVVADAQGNRTGRITVTRDEGVRAETTVVGLSKLRPAFKPNGSTTAGNSSQVSDGAAAVLLASRRRATELGLPILATLKSFAVVGVPPAIMGIGPAVAIPEALQRAKLRTSDIDMYEINEAFASQAVYCVEKLGLDPQKVNPLGGAIALGHPLGCTGARQVATLVHALHRRKAKRGVVSMCIGSGMGAAAVIEAATPSARAKL